MAQPQEYELGARFAMRDGFNKALERVAEGKEVGLPEVMSLLEAEGADLDLLYMQADAVRKRIFGDVVFLRGIIEFSNYCRKHCNYCGIRAANQAVTRYRMSMEEIVAVAVRAKKMGCSTVVLQSGEDQWFDAERLCSIVSSVKMAADVAVTLSIGERPVEEYIAFRKAGCDRFLLRFETSDQDLFKKVHPDDDFVFRVGCLKSLRGAGIQLGSGFLIGLPPGDLETIANDILFATSLQLDMIGCGPFVPHPQTPLAQASLLLKKEIYFKVISVLRLLNPLAHIPATTAFDVISCGGRDLLLNRGANVFMPNITPRKFSDLYQLYPNKASVDEEADQCQCSVVDRITRLNRKIGQGPGHSLLMKL